VVLSFPLLKEEFFLECFVPSRFSKIVGLDVSFLAIRGVGHKFFGVMLGSFLSRL